MGTKTGVDVKVRGKRQWRQRSPQGGPAAGGGAVYGLGMIGALVYFLGSAASGADYVLAFPKAMFWPAILVHKLLKSLDKSTNLAPVFFSVADEDVGHFG